MGLYERLSVGSWLLWIAVLSVILLGRDDPRSRSEHTALTLNLLTARRAAEMRDCRINAGAQNARADTASPRAGVWCYPQSRTEHVHEMPVSGMKGRRAMPNGARWDVYRARKSV